MQYRNTIAESEKGMKRLLTAVGLISFFACQVFGGEHAALARVTVYWPGEGSGANAAWNGARLNERHCAVDPKKIPYGSKVVFHDAECLAVDSGPDVVNRKAARLCGRIARERDAIVIESIHGSTLLLRCGEQKRHGVSLRSIGRSSPTISMTRVGVWDGSQL